MSPSRHLRRARPSRDSPQGRRRVGALHAARGGDPESQARFPTDERPALRRCCPLARNYPGGRLTLRVAYFGTWERGYPRNDQVTAALASAGVDVDLVHEDMWAGT